MTVLLTRLLGLSIGLMLAAAVPAAAGLSVGGAVVNIDPEQTPVSVVGYFTARYASDVVDELTARTLVIARDGGSEEGSKEEGSKEADNEDNTEKNAGPAVVAIQVVDSCGIAREQIDEAKAIASAATGIPVGAMFISATHTHTAPSAMPGLGTDASPVYQKQLVRQMAESIIAAHARRQPCEAGWDRRQAERFVYCRRWKMKPGTAETVPFTGHGDDVVQMNPGHGNPNALEQTGPVDPDVSVLAFRDPESKRPLAVLVNFNTHYAGAPMMSADYFGVVAREIGPRLDPEAAPAAGFVALSSNGTSGDANCIDFATSPAVAFDHLEVGEHVLGKAVEAYRGITNWTADAPLAVAGVDLDIAKRMPTADEVAAARAAVADWIDDRLPANKPEVYARETLLLADEPPTESVRLQTMRLGGFGLASIPCEVYGSTGLRIKQQSPLGFTMTIGWANGYSGYLPPPDQHALGGYTTWRCRSSFLDEQAEPLIVDELLRQFAELERR